MIKDSGERTDFDSGAQRDCAEGKGRLDLMPFRAMMELAKIYEEGAKKYDANNWRRGIPLSRYLDSGLRHLSKWAAGMRDEPHLEQAAWNIMGLIETQVLISEGCLPESLNDLPYNKLEISDNPHNIPELKIADPAVKDFPERKVNSDGIPTMDCKLTERNNFIARCEAHSLVAVDKKTLQMECKDWQCMVAKQTLKEQGTEAERTKDVVKLSIPEKEVNLLSQETVEEIYMAPPTKQVKESDDLCFAKEEAFVGIKDWGTPMTPEEIADTWRKAHEKEYPDVDPDGDLYMKPIGGLL